MKDTRQVEVHRLESWREELRLVRVVTWKYLIAAVVGAMVCMVYTVIARLDYVGLFLFAAVILTFVSASLRQLKVIRFIEKDLLSYILNPRICTSKDQDD